MAETLPIPAAPARPAVFDALVVGAGPTGMTAALALAEAGLSVALVAPMAGRDPRTTALLGPSVALLERLGVWETAAGRAAPLAVMRIVDDTNYLLRAPEVSFVASEIGMPAFGYNIANEDLNAALRSRIEASERLVVVDAPVEDIVFDADRLTVHAAGAGPVAARLVVGADGKDSIARTLAGIATRRWSYRQSAFVTTLSHARPHRNVSTEFHTAAGPFTLVPLPGDRSSLVWVDRPEAVERAAALEPRALGEEITRRAHRILGAMEVDGPHGAIPLEGLVATAMAADRVALVGEAAHRFPPIGAQGLNLGLRDVAALAEVVGRAVARGSDPGDAPVLSAYARRRQLDVSARTVGVDLLNRSLLTGALPVSLARGIGLGAAARIGPLRRLMMRAGLGPVVDAVGPAGRAA